jgi:hypothetical protein
LNEQLSFQLYRTFFIFSLKKISFKIAIVRTVRHREGSV